MVVDKGRETGERSAILIKNGHLKGIGFYELNHQINNIHILESILTPMQGNRDISKQISFYLTHRQVLNIIDLNSKN
jgi:DNA polymerase-3 subunit epsilon